mmetsp:Transcript_54068/g.107616  ORF Transcript_54068/g.107616 Transcript_54068/m.107616 type:complete len:527 (+) Transcript_54068:183-1763(+)
MVAQVCFFLALEPVLHGLACAQSRPAFADKPVDGDEVSKTCVPHWCFNADRNLQNVHSTRLLLQIRLQAFPGVLDVRTQDMTEDVDMTTNATGSSKQKVPATLPPMRHAISVSLQRLQDVVSVTWQRAKDVVSFAFHQDAVLGIWKGVGNHMDKVLLLVQTARHGAASSMGVGEFPIWVLFGCVGLAFCFLVTNTISLSRPLPARGMASTRNLSDPAVQPAEGHKPSSKDRATWEARWSPGPGSLRGSKVLTPQATSTQLDPRLPVADASPHSQHLDIPGPFLQGHSSMRSLPGSRGQVNPKRFCPQLCPGLVVPLGSECILAVQPVAPMPSSCESKMTTVQILDLCGKPVLKATVCRMRKSSSKPAVTLRMLESPHGRLESSVLATCSEDCAENGHRQMCIRDSNNKIFGHLGRDLSVTNRYMLQCVSGTDTRDSTKKCTVSFEGSFGNHKVLIQNDYQEQLADSEECVMNFSPCTKFYKLRVASGVDVGLMICCLVSIDELEVQVSREPLSQSDRISGGHNPWP